MRVARNVASLIPDGATLQTGIGGISEAVLHASTTSATWAFTPRCAPTA